MLKTRAFFMYGPWFVPLSCILYYFMTFSNPEVRLASHPNSIARLLLPFIRAEFALVLLMDDPCPHSWPPFIRPTAIGAAAAAEGGRD